MLVSEKTNWPLYVSCHSSNSVKPICIKKKKKKKNILYCLSTVSRMLHAKFCCDWLRDFRAILFEIANGRMADRQQRPVYTKNSASSKLARTKSCPYRFGPRDNNVFICQTRKTLRKSFGNLFPHCWFGIFLRILKKCEEFKTTGPMVLYRGVIQWILPVDS